MFVTEFNAIAKPLAKLIKVHETWQWKDEQENVFQELNVRLTFTSMLRQPIKGRPFQLHTNWCMLGLGTMFMDDEGREFVVAYMLAVLTTMLNPSTPFIKGNALL